MVINMVSKFTNFGAFSYFYDQQALLSAKAAKARLLDAQTIFTSIVTIILEWRQTDRQSLSCLS